MEDEEAGHEQFTYAVDADLYQKPSSHCADARQSVVTVGVSFLLGLCP
jgi:hypothetical protein